MDANKFITILNKIETPKGEIMNKIGLSYTGFDRSVKNGSMKVITLERFCIATNTHISEFFPEWIVIDERKIIPSKVQGLLQNDEIDYNKNINELLRSKDELIAEQRERIIELSGLLSMFKTGKIKVSE